MNTLEQWISNWLTCPLKDLNVYYLRTRKPFPTFERDVMAPQLSVSEHLLFQLHQRIRGRRAEWKIWDVVIFHISHPFPDSITNDLIDRDLCVHQLAHSSQNETILKRLVPLVDEALLTYAKPRYFDSRYSTEEFAEILDQYPTHDWLFDSLAHSVPSSPEKHEIFLAKASEHPNSERILSTERDMREGRGEELEKERILEAASHTDDESTLRELIDSRDYEILLRLIRNPNISEDALLSISQLRNFSGAQSIRGQAKDAIYRRKNSKLKHSNHESL